MDTASGQANLSDAGRAGPRRRLPLSPLAMGILVAFAIVALGAMAIVLLGIYPPPPPADSKTIVETWQANRTATPATLHANMLQIEKVGSPQKSGDTVTVTLKITNMVMQSAAVAGTPTPDAATPTPSQAKVYNGIVRVFFYKLDDKGRQEVVGSGLGNVVNLDYGQSAQIQVVSVGVGDFTDYVAVAESVWTDKDPVVKPTENPAPAAGGTPTP